MEKNMYKQVIADAKVLRANAIANAKASIQEAIEPKIQEIIRMKLTEDEELEETEELEEDLVDESEESLEESSLDEILSELESMEESEDLNESEDIFEEEGEDDEDSEESEEEDYEDDEDSEEVPEVDDEESESPGDTKLMDVSLDEFVSAITAAMQEEPGGLDGEEGEDMMDDQSDEEMPDMGGDEEAVPGEDAIDEFSLDEIIREMEASELEESDELEEGDDLEESNAKLGAPGFKAVKKKLGETQKELNEAKKTIKALQESFQEINLLNAKLLYMNKIFKAKSLNESQKMKVIKAFDRSQSVKEVKNMYVTLSESLSTSASKTQLKESIGFASKPAGVAPKTNIVESNDFVARWQKIAGIK